eukprot:TRINITY_DN3743_c0_g1_i1.p1 TRINITY_DN3743_c0_g1~~TRINITY_DN3743_c0_g1_i1.p1  ORF type:complete len:372 (+),score=65.91 TRINITY_DN3743_c0_g1_i1:36-1151(+)
MDVAWVYAVVLGCSHFGFRADGVDFLGRSMENGGVVHFPKEDHSYNWQVVKSPKGMLFNSTNEVMKSSDCRGLNTTGWVTQHAWVGIGFSDDFSRITDGVNAAGLTAQTHTFKGSQYQTVGDPASSLCYIDFTTWVLSSFATVNEVTAALETMRVVANPGIPIGGQLHWQISDANGGSLAVEYIRGELRAHNNTVQVFTNDPSFNWHLENINNYAPLSTKWPVQEEKIQVETEIGFVPEEISHGINLLGLPGDASPPSRFIRLFFLKQFALLNRPPLTFSEGFILANALLNAVYIPKGTLSHKDRKTDPTSDFTEFNTIKIPQRREYYYRTYHNTQWRKIDLNDVEWGNGITSHNLLTPFDMGILDVTDTI